MGWNRKICPMDKPDNSSIDSYKIETRINHCESLSENKCKKSNYFLQKVRTTSRELKRIYLVGVSLTGTQQLLLRKIHTDFFAIHYIVLLIDLFVL